MTNPIVERLRDYFAWLKHLRHEEMDTATSGLWGYWKREPFWPRAALNPTMTMSEGANED